MFSGLVNGQGEVIAVDARAGQARLRIRALFAWADPRVGESVAVNGACLTAETWEGESVFAAYASAETLAHTTLGDLRPGARVNLERALALGDRLGGHLVSGHVDAVARVAAVTKDGESRRVRLEFDPAWSGQIIPKGSVALDGVSLTVNACGPGFLEVNVIPETWRVTTAAHWAPGRAVNLETDMIGKYVQHALAPAAPAPGGLTLDFLRENGF